MYKIDVDKLIYVLRQKKLTYRQIKEELEKYEIKISVGTVRDKCKRTYALFDEKEPIHSEGKVSDEEIQDMRKKGFSYQRMADELEKKGEKVSISTLANRSKEIFANEGVEVPKIHSYTINEDDILRLRLEENLTFAEIAEMLSDKENKIPVYIVSERFKEICEQRDIIASKHPRKYIDFDNEIIRLREVEGKTFEEIGKMMPDNKQRTKQEIQRRYARTVKLTSKQLANEILKLTITRKATLEQVKVLADYYGVDLDEVLNSLEEK